MESWEPLHKYPPNELTCVCGTYYSSHARFSATLKRIEPELPCPKCGRKDGIIKLRSKPERFTL